MPTAAAASPLKNGFQTTPFKEKSTNKMNSMTEYKTKKNRIKQRTKIKSLIK